MPAQKIDEALACLRSAFPKTQFKIENGQITGGGIVVAQGLLNGTSLAMVRIVGSQLKAIEEQADAARKASDERLANLPDGQASTGGQANAG